MWAMPVPYVGLCPAYAKVALARGSVPMSSSYGL